VFTAVDITTTRQTIGGHYQILRSLGEGNFGLTYLAEDLHARKRQVVVKQFCFVCNSQTTLNKAKELFEREGEVLYHLSNSFQNNQIPRFIGFFEENQEFYLVEEFIEGRTLREELAEKIRLTEDEVVDFLKDVLSILKVINEKGIVHRDIKPDNVIIRASDRMACWKHPEPFAIVQTPTAQAGAKVKEDFVCNRSNGAWTSHITSWGKVQSLIVYM
jgi:serine/threonine protein kinase